jgi:hypothetical protein
MSAITKAITAATVCFITGATLAAPNLTVEGRKVSTPGHVFTLDDSGLPAQIDLRVGPGDLPLSERAVTPPSESVVRRIGRGPQLQTPIRIEAIIGGEPAVAVPESAAAPKLEGDAVETRTAWRAGALRGTLTLRYSDDGAVQGYVRCDAAANVALERLDVVLDVSGAVDTVIAGNPTAPSGDTLLPVNFGVLPSETGVLWRNGAQPIGGGIGVAGPVRHYFLGNGDRGFTWLGHAGGTMPTTAGAADVIVERTKEGTVVWRMALGTGPVRQAAEGRFTLLIHPARPRPADGRVKRWQNAAAEVAAPPLTAEARGTVRADAVRADAASIHESFASQAILVGAAGGDARTVEATLADRVPLALFRYLACTHTALGATLRTDAGALVPAGGTPVLDRMALGRALLHDIGVDIRTLSGRVEAATVVRALERFGFFEDDGKTEYLPYWRTDGIVRYGEAFGAAGAFEVTEENPAARAKVSVFLRPADAAGKKRKALFVVVNESPTEVREQLYILNPAAIFGGSNRLSAGSIYSALDFSRIPATSDWRKEMVVGNAAAYEHGSRPEHPQLMDLETGGFVRTVRTRDGSEIYGLLHVPGRGMRLLFGSGE